MKKDADFAIVVTLPSAFIHHSQFLRGFEDWFLDFVTRPRLLAMLFDAVLDVNLAMVQAILREVGDLIDVVVTADDIGDQRGTVVSPAMYRELIKPRQKMYFDEIHRLTAAKLVYHTCGSVADVLEDLIEIGVEVLNPVQTGARGMDPDALKAIVGERLAFWGGIDCQCILPRGSVWDIEKEKQRMSRALGGRGGYVVSPAHNIQRDVPSANVCALFLGHRRGVTCHDCPRA